MNIYTLLPILIILWFILGGVSVWRMYWGEVKEYHIKYNIDKTLSFKQLFTKEKVYKVYIILLLYGLASLILVEIFVETAWYYKIPEKIIEPIQTDFGKMPD